MKVPGSGNFSQGKYGNLYIHFKIQPHSSFIRDGLNIKSNIEISLIEALEGIKKSVETIDGKVEVEIPRGIQPQQTLRLKYRGIKSSKTGKIGDHLVNIKVKIPQLDEGQLSQAKNIFCQVSKQWYKLNNFRGQTNKSFFKQIQERLSNILK